MESVLEWENEKAKTKRIETEELIMKIYFSEPLTEHFFINPRNSHSYFNYHASIEFYSLRKLIQILVTSKNLDWFIFSYTISSL